MPAKIHKFIPLALLAIFVFAPSLALAHQPRVWSSNNDSKYSLAIGELEKFDGKEILNALTLIPQIKKDFFNKSPIDFILSPFGWGLIVVMYILAFVVGIIYRLIMKRLAKGTVRGVSKNLNTSGRVIRFALGVMLLLWAILTSWNPILIFLSGFALFEAIFSWCAVYQLMRKNTCPSDLSSESLLKEEA